MTILTLRRIRSNAASCLEKPLTVAFLGPVGTFAQQAAYKHFGHAIQVQPYPAIDEIFRAVES
ncbi:MAG: prephenate dehydratase domain-containing protein, partial [Rhodoferax sp.]